MPKPNTSFLCWCSVNRRTPSIHWSHATNLTWASNLRGTSRWLAAFVAAVALFPPPAPPLLGPPFSPAPCTAGAASDGFLALPSLLGFLVLAPPPVADEELVGSAPAAAVLLLPLPLLLPLLLILPSSWAIFDRSKTSFDGTIDGAALRGWCIATVGGGGGATRYGDGD